MKNSHFCFLLFLIACSTTIAVANDPIVKIGWKKIESLETPQVIKQETGSKKPHALLTIEAPKIDEWNHAIGGEIRYTNVVGTGFAEMWTHYEGRGPFFSRTLGESGSPMAKLTGNSDWRPFLLPFFGDGEGLPTKLKVNLILPAGGEVEFRNVGLYQLPGNRTKTLERNLSGLLGVIGCGVGILGAIGGTLFSLGKARRFVLGLLVGGIVFGAILSILGIVAVITHQPQGVWVPLCALGGTLLLVCSIRYPSIRKSYIDHELRTISAAG